MTKHTKLYRELSSEPIPIVSFRDFVGLLEAFGFVLKRTRGSHRSYRHPAVPALLVVQPHGNEAKRYQIRQFLDMVHAYGLALGDT